MFKIMKKLIFLSAVLFVFAACSGTEEQTYEPQSPYEQTVIVEVFFVNSDGVETIPTTSVVWIFEDADFDLGAVSHFSMMEMPQKMTLKDGVEVGSIFHSPQDFRLGVHRHVFENVPNGEYFITMTCFVQDAQISYSRGFRRITVDRGIHEVVQRIVFTDNDLLEQAPPIVWFVEK